MEHWNALLVTHVVAALFVLAVGPVQILRRRRDRIHRTMGYLWVAAMYYVCFSSFGIVSDGHFSWLHGLSAFTIVTVTLGLISAVRRNIPAHRGNMIGSYIGIAVAFGFAVGVPGRSIPLLLLADPGTAVFVAALVLLSVGVAYASLIRGDRKIIVSPARSNREPRGDNSGDAVVAQRR
ncbi:membrane protein-like protein [Pseudarthrobacter chlorophenolicus A6]|uniref:Membrane protein-like protein n=1 Tax=Pseudarthrobacter chlorophenolicus (strain ATCC 700700 / DSM 12829 / CIP 107037 / JCM 12360 / KCTC 9906 / NCIMB 13794 / A6) TaxID=452863 RepID=B8HCG1_PSECP|nr:DUF2306 domain-containing protein [Pseudarthrobacter chlorophenolicus]ACL40577.1 membrane protein-like protein [Pseudarthrobacter chlorophenolicus A6]SDQ79028.1 Uncharacterized membrane protein [Pseudarthrobacter chlorophenolicus]